MTERRLDAVYLTPEEKAGLTNKNSFWVQIIADNMGPFFEFGDSLLIDKDARIENGDIVVVAIDHKGFIKKIEIKDDTITFISFDPDCAPVVFTEDEFAKINFVYKAVAMERDL